MSGERRQKKGVFDAKIQRIFLAVILAMLVAALCACDDKVQSDTPEVTAELVIDPNIGDKPTPKPTEPGIAIPGWGGIVLSAGTLETDVELFNPEDNAGWYYLMFELSFADTGEVIFTTGLIPPGKYCTRVTLNRELEKGEYACNMHVQPYTMDDVPQMRNNADFDIQLIVR